MNWPLALALTPVTANPLLVLVEALASHVEKGIVGLVVALAQLKVHVHSGHPGQVRLYLVAGQD